VRQRRVRDKWPALRRRDTPLLTAQRRGSIAGFFIDDSLPSELLNVEALTWLGEGEELISDWREQYNDHRPVPRSGMPASAVCAARSTVRVAAAPHHDTHPGGIGGAPPARQRPPPRRPDLGPRQDGGATPTQPNHDHVDDRGHSYPAPRSHPPTRTSNRAAS
jgi:hypothetical protein